MNQIADQAAIDREEARKLFEPFDERWLTISEAWDALEAIITHYGLEVDTNNREDWKSTTICVIRAMGNELNRLKGV